MKQTQKIGIVLAGAGCILLGSYGVYHLTRPKTQAKLVLKRYLNACMAGDTEEILRYSVTEQLAPLYGIYTDADGNETYEPEAFARELANDSAEIEKYEIETCRDCLQEMKDQIELLRLNDEKERKILEKHGLRPDPDAQANQERYIGYLESVECAYTFDVQIRMNGTWNEDCMEIPVVRTGGVWKADPVSAGILIPVIHDPDETEPNGTDAEAS